MASCQNGEMNWGSRQEADYAESFSSFQRYALPTIGNENPTRFDPFFNSLVAHRIIKPQGCTLYSGEPTNLRQIFRIKCSQGHYSRPESMRPPKGDSDVALSLIFQPTCRLFARDKCRCLFLARIQICPKPAQYCFL